MRRNGFKQYLKIFYTVMLKKSQKKVKARVLVFSKSFVHDYFLNK